MNIVRQNYNEPIYPELVWSKPETKTLGGKLLIVGGNSHAISAPSAAYGYAAKQGTGEVKAVMPNSTKKLFGGLTPPGIEFVKSTPSGSFSKDTLPELLSYCDWADAVLFAGDLSRNSETAVLLESILQKTTNIQIFTKDVAEYLVNIPSTIFKRENSCLVVSFSQLQKLFIASGYKKQITFDIPLKNFEQILADFSQEHKTYIITQRHEYIFVAVNGEVSITKLKETPSSWRLNTATKVAVWWMQNPQKPFQALTTAITQ